MKCNKKMELKIPNTNLTLYGHSRAAEETGFVIKEWNIGIDCGFNLNKIPDHIFITHTHIDHICKCSIFSYNSNNSVTYYVPNQSSKYLCNYINSGIQLCKSSNSRNFFKWIKTKELDENSIIKLKNGRNEIEIKSLICDHGVPTLGYCFYENKNKLKKEYIGLSQSEIINLKKNGMQIVENIKYPQFIFVGDTTINFFDLNPKIFELGFKTIVIECTFLLEDDYYKISELDSKGNNKYKHIHYKDLKAFILNNQDITFILIHFSMRYKEEEIKNFFEKEGIKNIIPWLDNYKINELSKFEIIKNKYFKLIKNYIIKFNIYQVTINYINKFCNYFFYK